MPRYKANLYLKQSMHRRSPTLSDDHVRIGQMEDPSQPDKMFYTTFRCWVPSPQIPGHLPGIFLSLDNTAGYSFTRIDPPDYQKLKLNLESWSASLTAAYDHATLVSNRLIAAHSKELDSIPEFIPPSPS